ncbi:hypothetical protein A5886_001035 [Enterococcus sp. 8G7_MSG3316]|uniref:DUF3324 domain-containing protein n=1 Tax=Candidatus Enterococcus testudinis TaxID=1834191 RepID=A0A242A4W6_9ENTE|nr:hypothetical protein [Enterococcus sp. 8G7_MSG3316]OTN75959.1 hypothetical protein A5886_001035 [Enterococcus sp. 8G7_MSG3316]
MNCRCYQLPLFFVVSALFFLLPTTTYAQFQDVEDIQDEIQLSSGFLSFDSNQLEKHQISFTEHSNQTEITVDLKNSGSLDGKLSYTLETILLDSKPIEPSELAEYFNFTLPKQNTSILSTETHSILFNFKKLKSLLKGQTLTLEIKVRLSQINIKEATYGFIDEKTIVFSYSEPKSADSNNWIDDNLFKNNDLYVEKKLFYSIVNGRATTVIPGIVYYKFKDKQLLSQAEQDIAIKNLTTLLNSSNLNNNVEVDKIDYIEKKGFRIQFKMDDKSLEGRSNVYGITLETLDQESKKVDISQAVKPLLMIPDALETDADKDLPLQSSISGTRYNFFSITESNNFWWGITEFEDIKYIKEHYSISIEGVDSEWFSFSFSDTNDLMIKQKNSKGGLSSQLTFRDKDTHIVVFSREITSINQKDLSEELTASLYDDFQFKAINNDITLSNGVFSSGMKVYLKIPKNFISQFYDQTITLGPGITSYNIVYSLDEEFMEISYQYQSTTFPWSINQTMIFKKFDMSGKILEKWISFEVLNDQSTLQKLMIENQSQSSESGNSPENNINSQSTKNKDLIDSILSDSTYKESGLDSDVQQEAKETSPDSSEGTADESSEQFFENSSASKPESSTSQSTEPATNQTEPSKEPE